MVILQSIGGWMQIPSTSFSFLFLFFLNHAAISFRSTIKLNLFCVDQTHKIEM